MVWLQRDPFSLLRASTGLDGMFRVAQGIAGPVARPHRPAPTPSARPTATAPTNLHVTDEVARLASLLPGYGPDDLDLTVEGRSVHLRGRRTGRDSGAVSTFERTFQLPFAVDAEGVEARVADGVLQLEVPRRADDRPARIPIAGATRPTVTVEAAETTTPEASDASEGPETETETAETTSVTAGESAPEPTSGPARLRPRAGARRTDGGLELTLEIPGATRDSIRLEVEAGELHLSADTAFEPWTGDASPVAWHREFPFPGGYEARWALPEDVDPERAESSYDRGLLTVVVPVRAAQRHSIRVG